MQLMTINWSYMIAYMGLSALGRQRRRPPRQPQPRERDGADGEPG